MKEESPASPYKKKNKLGALYNPNYTDPRKMAAEYQPEVCKPAGVQTSFGLLHNYDHKVLDQQLAERQKSMERIQNQRYNSIEAIPTNPSGG